LRYGHFRDQAAGAGKRERTRAVLIDAAIKVVAEKGIEALKITDVTTMADLANGTFYNHFEDKDAILRAAAYGIAGEISRQLDADMERITDAPTRVVTATARFISIVIATPDWAAVMLASADHLPQVRAEVAQFLRYDLELGIIQGKFDVEMSPFLVDQVMSLIAAALRAQLIDGVDLQVTRQVCESILRLLGLSPAKARKFVASLLQSDQTFA
jgi:AcrR family transcriptional regulator